VAPRTAPAIELDEPDHPDDPEPSLTARRLAQLSPDTRPLPSVVACDQLFRITKPKTAEGNS
jgi:hypothetical protein